MRGSFAVDANGTLDPTLLLIPNQEPSCEETTQNALTMLSNMIGIFRDLNSFKKWGWDKMPGQEKADYAVARECADGLELTIK